MRGAIILAGGTSVRLGEDKALLPFRGRRMIEHVLSVAQRVCDKTVISCRDEEQKNKLSHYGDCVVDERKEYGPLEGIYQGCLFFGEGYACILACDMPFVSGAVVDFLFEYAKGHSSAIPSYPQGTFEPLHAAYRIEETAEACRKVFEAERKRIFDMIDLLSDVAYVSTERIREIDPALRTFVNINTQKDLEEYG